MNRYIILRDVRSTKYCCTSHDKHFFEYTPTVSLQRYEIRNYRRGQKILLLKGCTDSTYSYRGPIIRKSVTWRGCSIGSVVITNGRWNVPLEVLWSSDPARKQKSVTSTPILNNRDIQAATASGICWLLVSQNSIEALWYISRSTSYGVYIMRKWASSRKRFKGPSRCFWSTYCSCCCFCG